MNNEDIGNEETVKVLIRNAVKCLSCNTVLESKYRHDYQCCGCENQTIVDGGRVYSRVGGKDFNLIEDLCKYKEYTKQEYESLQQEHKERQRISNTNNIGVYYECLLH